MGQTKSENILVKRIGDNSLMFLNHTKIDGCPFCGGKNIEYIEAHGTYNQKSISIQTSCYGCHTIKYIALVSPTIYLNKEGVVNITAIEMAADDAIRAWNERPSIGIIPGTEVMK